MLALRTRVLKRERIPWRGCGCQHWQAYDGGGTEEMPIKIGKHQLSASKHLSCFRARALRWQKYDRGWPLTKDDQGWSLMTLGDKSQRGQLMPIKIGKHQLSASKHLSCFRARAVRWQKYDQGWPLTIDDQQWPWMTICRNMLGDDLCHRFSHMRQGCSTQTALLVSLSGNISFLYELTDKCRARDTKSQNFSASRILCAKNFRMECVIRFSQHIYAKSA